MEEIKLTCKACGEETMRPPKPAPQNAREGKQPRFHCPHCKAVNLRDGTIRPRKPLEIQETPQEALEEKKEGSSIGAVIVSIGLGLLGVLAVFFLNKSLKGKGSGPGQNNRLPWNSIR